jgi:head-tail adaptor
MAFISEIKAGDFNYRLRIRKSSQSDNSFGEYTTSYTTEATVWAIKNVTSLRNINEKFEGDQLQSYGNFFFTVRYDSTWANLIQGTWELQNNDSPNETYEVLSWVIDPRKEYIEFYARLNK